MAQTKCFRINIELFRLSYGLFFSHLSMMAMLPYCQAPCMAALISLVFLTSSTPTEFSIRVGFTTAGKGPDQATSGSSSSLTRITPSGTGSPASARIARDTPSTKKFYSGLSFSKSPSPLSAMLAHAWLSAPMKGMLRSSKRALY